MHDSQPTDRFIPKGGHARPYLDLLMSAVVIAAGCVVMSNNFPEPDLWGHVQYGRDLLQHGLPSTATYTYTATGHPWINHEILSELALAMGMDLIGSSGLLIGKCLIAAALLAAVLVAAMRNGADRLSAYVTVLLVATNLTFFWNLRPQLFSFGLFTLEIILLNWCFSGWHGRWWLPFPNRLAATGEPQYCSLKMRHLWLAPVIFFVWANTHGAFLAGLLIFIVYLSIRSLEAIACRGRAAIGLVRRFALMSLAATAASMINPYGPGLHAWLFESLVQPRPEIIEWLPPEVAWNAASLAWVPFWLLSAVTVLALVREWRTARTRSHGNSAMSLDATELFILLIVFWQAIEHRRHIPLAALLVGLWMPRLFGRLAKSWHAGRPNVPLDAFLPRPWKVPVTALLVTYLVMALTILHGQTQILPVRRDLYPVRALQFLADHKLHGNGIVAFDWAQYAIMALGSRGSSGQGFYVQFDGRFDTCYPRRIVDQHFDFELGNPGPYGRYRDPNSPDPNGDRLLATGSPNLMVLHRGKTHSTAVAERNREHWTLLYQDQIAQIWGRSDWYDNPSDAHYLPHHLRQIDNSPQQGFVPWPALPNSNAALTAIAPPTSPHVQRSNSLPEVELTERGTRFLISIEPPKDQP